MPFTLEALQTELLTDPNAYGYAALIAVRDIPGLVAMVNLPRAAIVMNRSDCTPLEILEAISVDDFVATANQSILFGSWFESLTQFPLIPILKPNGADTRVMTNIMKVLKNGTASETRIRALAQRPGSRAEQLWGAGFTVTNEQVSGALGS